MKMKKMLSILTATVMSASCFVGMVSNAGAEEVKYAEWLLNDEYSSTNTAGTDGAFADGTAATVMNLSSKSETVTAPTLYYSRTPAKDRANAYSTFYGAGQNFTTISGQTITPLKGFKCSGNGNYGYTFVLDPKLADNSADSYDLQISYWSNSGTDATTVKIVSVSEFKFGQVNDGTAIKEDTSTNREELKTITLEGLTSPISFGFSAQPGFTYAGIKYNTKQSTEPTITVSDPEVIDSDASSNPAVLFRGEVTPNDYTITGLTWKYGIETASASADTLNVNISGTTTVKYGLVVELATDDAKSAKDNIKAELEVASKTVTKTSQN
ncbi:MAG: hypothetical protein Q4G33_05870 [bacterium]|nr:hypothetical protein [bacterium]